MIIDNSLYSYMQSSIPINTNNLLEQIDLIDIRDLNRYSPATSKWIWK